jgi:hypothetical protein
MTTKGKRKVSEPRKQDVNDEFNDIGVRTRNATEEILLHGTVSENKQDDGRSFFVAEARVNLYLEDGRTLSKVFDLEFEEDDLN